jgi:ankyrin repeat protein
LERGADVNAKGGRKDGRTALETAAENDRIDMVRFLVNSGAHIIDPDAHQYWQARTLALKHGHFAVCKLLEALYEEKSGGQSLVQVLSSADVDFDFWSGIPTSCDLSDESLVQVLSSADVDFDFSSGIPTSCDVSDEPLDLTPIKNFGEANDNQSGSASSVESWAWPLSSIPDFSLDDLPDEWSYPSTSLL